MKMDVYLEEQGHKRISNNRVTDIDQPVDHGIDGVYLNASKPPKYLIVESKYGQSTLSTTNDGKQMSDDWIEGSISGKNRLEQAVGSDCKIP